MTSQIKSLWARVARLIPLLPALSPDKDEYGCDIVDQTNFNDIVLRNNKDVLIAFYTPIVHIDKGGSNLLGKRSARSYIGGAGKDVRKGSKSRYRKMQYRTEQGSGGNLSGSNDKIISCRKEKAACAVFWEQG